jgi:methionine-rich copper-binding protein CopC
MTPRIPAGRLQRALVVAWLLALALPHGAVAHAELVRANPADGEVVTAPVTAVTGRYSEDLKAGSRLVVKDASGATVGSGEIDPGNDRRMIARIAPALTQGTFTVESTSISAHDGDIERVTWSFTVSIPASPSPTPSPSAGASPTAAPSPSVPPSSSESPSVTASPTPGDPTSGTAGDVLLPIIAALAIIAVGAGFLLNRSRAPRP